MDTSLIYILLAALLLLSILSEMGRKALLARNAEDWMIDGLSLFNHFVVIPAVHVALILPLLHFLIPNLKGSVNLSWPWALVANMVVDYGWYWNHRLFHARTKLWSLHAVHHEPESLDIFKTSRNTFWSPFLMVYFWLIPLFIF